MTAGPILEQKSKDDFYEINNMLSAVHGKIIDAMNKRESSPPNSGTQEGFEWNMLHSALKSVGAAGDIMYEVGNLTGRYKEDK